MIYFVYNDIDYGMTVYDCLNGEFQIDVVFIGTMSKWVSDDVQKYAEDLFLKRMRKK